MRLAAYVGASVALAGGVVLKALHQRANFYSACVYLSQSNANLMILTNLCLLIVGFFVFGLQRLLYGRLRAIETEQLYEKAWFAVTETCLAMTIFRGEMGGWFLVMFVCLLVGKLWGWIGQGRLEVLEQQPPSNPRLFHTRLAISLILSVAFDAFLLDYAVKTVLRQARPDMMVMFGFEFAVLTILSASTAARYVICLVELYIVSKQKRIKLAERRRELQAAREEERRQREAAGADQDITSSPEEEEIDEMELDVPGWEEKGRWVFYLDLITDFLKLVVYLCFFAILFTFYGLPIHILRDVVLTMKSFAKRILHFLRYRHATRDMNQRYPDATADEIAREDVCIICREEMRPWQQPGATGGQAPRVVSERLRPKKLPCGHLLHFACLRSWLERQQNCPTCRRPVATTGAAPQGGQPMGAAGGIGNAAVPGQQQMPGLNPPGAAAQNGRAAADAGPRAWFLNLGPVRVGFGAGRGDVVRNLVQQMHGEQPDGAAAVPAAANPVPVPVDQQQLGFGFGFGRRPPNPPQFNLQNVQLQILQIEHQILQEINGLMTTAEQLNLVRQLQGELARLRAGQPPQNLNQNQAQAMHNPDYDRIYVPPAPNPNPGFSSIQRHYTAYHPGVTTMGAGDTRLPEGLTLPQGWSLLPLQRAPPTTMVGANPHLPHLQQQQHLQTGQSSTTSSQPGGAGVLGNPLHQTTVAPDENSPNLHQQTSPPPATGGVEEQAGVTSSASTMDSKARPGSGGNSDAPEERSSILGESSSASTSSAASSSSSSSSSSKGKSREATVEDADRE